MKVILALLFLVPLAAHCGQTGPGSRAWAYDARMYPEPGTHYLTVEDDEGSPPCPTCPACPACAPSFQLAPRTVVICHRCKVKHGHPWCATCDVNTQGVTTAP